MVPAIADHYRGASALRAQFRSYVLFPITSRKCFLVATPEGNQHLVGVVSGAVLRNTGHYRVQEDERMTRRVPIDRPIPEPFTASALARSSSSAAIWGCLPKVRNGSC